MQVASLYKLSNIQIQVTALSTVKHMFLHTKAFVHNFIHIFM